MQIGVVKEIKDDENRVGVTPAGVAAFCGTAIACCSTRLRRGQVIFTYLHLAANETLTRELLAREVVAIGYETVQLADGALPLLVPMSEVAGCLSIQAGQRSLERHAGGKGILLPGVSGVRAAAS